MLAVSRAARADERLRRTDRILTRVDYLRVQRQGTRVQTPHFLVMVLPAERQRLGITVTRRAAGAVGRNRIRRLAREVFRRNRGLFPAGCELVLVARSGADRLDYASLRAELVAVEDSLARAARPTRPAPKRKAPPS